MINLDDCLNNPCYDTSVSWVTLWFKERGSGHRKFLHRDGFIILNGSAEIDPVVSVWSHPETNNQRRRMTRAETSVNRQNKMTCTHHINPFYIYTRYVYTLRVVQWCSWGDYAKVMLQYTHTHTWASVEVSQGSWTRQQSVSVVQSAGQQGNSSSEQKTATSLLTFLSYLPSMWLVCVGSKAEGSTCFNVNTWEAKTEYKIKWLVEQVLFLHSRCCFDTPLRHTHTHTLPHIHTRTAASRWEV